MAIVSIMRMIQAEEAAVAAKQLAMDEMSVSASYPTSPLLQGIVPPSLVKRGEILSNKIVQKEIHLRSKRRLLRRIMLVMDGMHCDDELSCMFEHPIENLVEMLQTTGRWDVFSDFSCGEWKRHDQGGVSGGRLN